MKLFQMYSFQIVLAGTLLLAIAASIVGTMNVYKNQSLIGDALGHSTFPGLILAFMLSGQRNPTILLLGAMATASLSYFLINYSTKNSKIGADANMAIYLSGFFGLGLVLKSYVQGNPSYSGASKSGLDNYIFGQAAYLLKADVYLILLVAIICLACLGLFYKEIKCYLFDKDFAQILGINGKKLDYLILFLTILVIGVGIKAVGVILISSLLIIPTITASKLSHNFLGVIGLSSLFSCIAAFVGASISTLYSGFSTGPTIILCQGLIGGLVMVYVKIAERRPSL